MSVLASSPKQIVFVRSDIDRARLLKIEVIGLQDYQFEA